MRGVTITVNSMDRRFRRSFVVVDIRFDDVPDTGPESLVANVLALDKDTALRVLKEGCGPDGKRTGFQSPPNPTLMVIDEEAMKSLDPALFDTYKVVEGYNAEVA